MVFKMSDKAEILDDNGEKLYELHDGMENLIANLGTNKDKRSYSKFVDNKKLSTDGGKTELTALYRTNWLAGKIIDIIPDDMTREWRSFIGDIDPETVTTLEEEEARLDLRGAFNFAHKWARLYGTAFIILSVDDGLSPDEPLDIESIRPGELRHIKAIDRHRVAVQSAHIITDPLSADYGLPEFYTLTGTGVRIHSSRMIRFDGAQLPYDSFQENGYYSDSILNRIYDTLINFSTAVDGAASMIYESNVDILKIKGLMGFLKTAEGEATVKKRFSLAKLLKSFNNMLLLDNDEDFVTNSVNFSGVALMMDRFSLYAGASGDVPATRLFGSSASGFNATGEGDLKNYYDTVRSLQQRDYRPKLDYFDPIMAKNLGLADDVNLDYKFNSLFQLTEKEISEMTLVNAQRDQIYIDRDIVSELTIAKELKQNGVYTNITDGDIEELEEAVNVVIEKEVITNANPAAISQTEPSPDPENAQGREPEGQFG